MERLVGLLDIFVPQLLRHLGDRQNIRIPLLQHQAQVVKTRRIQRGAAARGAPGISVLSTNTNGPRRVRGSKA